MLNWREYRVLCSYAKIAVTTDVWNLQCRMQSIPRACNRSLAKPVTSFFGLQSINGSSGDDRGLCTTLLESSGLDASRIQYTASEMGSFAMLAENPATMISRARNSARARETWKKKLETFRTINVEQEMENQLETSHFARFDRCYSTRCMMLFPVKPSKAKNNRRKYSSW